MAQKVLVFTSNQNLYCGTLPQQLSVAIPFEKARERDCPEDAGQYSFSYVLGSLIKKECVGCGSLAQWMYWFDYDDEQVIENYELLPGDVLGFSCFDSSDQLLLQAAGSACYVYTDEDDNVIFVNQYGCEYTIIEGGA